jgi:hypothetical protein
MKRRGVPHSGRRRDDEWMTVDIRHLHVQQVQV